jgi:hypothetical protein
MNMEDVKKIIMFEYKETLFKTKEELIEFKNKEIFEEISKLFESNEKSGESIISTKNLQKIIKEYKIKNLLEVLEFLNKTKK